MLPQVDELKAELFEADAARARDEAIIKRLQSELQSFDANSAEIRPSEKAVFDALSENLAIKNAEANSIAQELKETKARLSAMHSELDATRKRNDQIDTELRELKARTERIDPGWGKTNGRTFSGGRNRGEETEAERKLYKDVTNRDKDIKNLKKQLDESRFLYSARGSELDIVKVSLVVRWAFEQ